MDLLTVALHEVGHVLGSFDHAASGDAHDVMSETLEAGVRRVVDAAHHDDRVTHQTGPSSGRALVDLSRRYAAGGEDAAAAAPPWLDALVSDYRSVTSRGVAGPIAISVDAPMGARAGEMSASTGSASRLVSALLRGR
jgi:hypothetical protein